MEKITVTHKIKFGEVSKNGDIIERGAISVESLEKLKSRKKILDYNITSDYLLITHKTETK